MTDPCNTVSAGIPAIRHLNPDPRPPLCMQDVLEHVSTANGDRSCTASRAQTFGGVGSYIHPQVPAIILPGKGPMEVDYSVSGQKGV